MSVISPVAESDAMPEENTKKPKGRLLRKLKKYILYGAVSLVFIILAANAIWLRSGSNNWELAIDKDGVKVYTLKSPGSSVVKFKGVTKYKYTLSQMLLSFNDDSYTGEDCGKYMPGCVEYRFLKPWDPKRMSNTQYWRFGLGGPFADREMVLLGTVFQDKETKEVVLENIAVPNEIPPNDCCVRLTHMHNIWRYTPVGNGELQVEYTQDFDLGGFFPDFLLSLGASQVHMTLHTFLPELIESKEAYATAKVDFIEDY